LFQHGVDAERWIGWISPALVNGRIIPAMVAAYGWISPWRQGSRPCNEGWDESGCISPR